VPSDLFFFPGKNQGVFDRGISEGMITQLRFQAWRIPDAGLLKREFGEVGSVVFFYKWHFIA